ncbi:MAG: hypothetical protein AMXMBFR12_08970 [Candidatus Babeliales bacterium]
MILGASGGVDLFLLREFAGLAEDASKKAFNLKKSGGWELTLPMITILLTVSYAFLELFWLNLASFDGSE